MNIFRNLFANARMEIVNTRHARNHVIINGEIMDRNKIFEGFQTALAGEI